MLARVPSLFVCTCLALATSACGDEGGSACGEEGSIGPGTGAGTIAGLAVAPDGALVTLTNLVIFQLDGGGNPVVSATITRHGLLGFTKTLGGMHAHGLVVDGQGRVWVLADTLRGYTAAGIPLPLIPATTFVAVAQDGTLITGGPPVGATQQSPELVRWTVTGELVARATLVAPGAIIRDVAIAGDGTVYAVEGPPPPGGTGFRVHALTPGFDTKWTFDLDGESADVDIAVTPEPGVVVGLRDQIVSIDAGGALRWRFAEPFAVAGLAVGPDGSVYTTGGALSPSGALRWRGGAPVTVAADGTLYGLAEGGLATLDPATGAIDKILSHAKYSDGWEVQPVFADAAGDGCVYTGAHTSTDGIFVDTILLESHKATRAGIAAPWGIPGGNAGRTSAAPLESTVPRAVADLYGFWVRDDGDDRVTIEIMATIPDPRAPEGPAYRVWRTRPYDAGEVVQVGGAAVSALSGEARLVLTRVAGDGPGSTSALGASSWTELTLVDPSSGATETFTRAYRVARPTRPSPTVDDAFQSDTQTDGFQTLGGQRAAHAFADPADGAFWLVQSVAGSADALEVHRLDPRTQEASTARVSVPAGVYAYAPEIVAGEVDEAGRLVLLTGDGHSVTVPRDPTEPATTAPVEDHWWQLEPWADALAAADVAIHARAVDGDGGGDITIVGTFDGALDLGDGVRLERIATTPGRDLMVARLGADGRAKWARAFATTLPGAPWPDRPYDTIGLAVFEDGGLAIAGRFSHRGPFRDNPQTVPAALDLGLGPLTDTTPLDVDGPGDGFLVRFDAEGHPLGQALLPGRELRGMVADPSGLLVATGVDHTPAATQGLVAVYDRCARELTWGVPPCAACIGPPRLANLAGTDVARAPDGRLMVAAETMAADRIAGAPADNVTERLAAAVFVAPIVPDGDTVPITTCPAITPPRIPLSVRLEGDGSGRVVSDPPGIDCPGACSADFDVLTRVTLTATAAADAWHAGWDGCVPDGDACRWEARFEGGAVVAIFERPARRVLASLPDGVGLATWSWVGFGYRQRTHVARADGSILTLVTAQAPVDLGGGVTIAGGGQGSWLALGADGAPLWARALGPEVRFSGHVRVEVAPDGSFMLNTDYYDPTMLRRWSATGEPRASWTLDFGAVDQPTLVALAATHDGALAVTRSLGGTNGIITWPETDGVVTRYDADGAPTPIDLPGADVRGVFALPDGDVILVFVHDASIDFLGQPLNNDGTQDANAIARLGPEDELRWVRPLDIVWNGQPADVAASTGGVAVLFPGTLLALAPDGAERWRQELRGNPVSLAVGTDGAVTHSETDGSGSPHVVRHGAATGALAWEADLGGTLAVDPAGRTVVLDPFGTPLTFMVLDP